MADPQVAIALLPAGPAAALAMLRGLTDSFSGAVRILVVRGEGADFFCGEAVGDDSEPTDVAGTRAEFDQSILRNVRRNDLISIAVLHGRATGVGLALALACDQRIVTDDAQLAFVADTGHRRLDVEALCCLRQLVGRAPALDLALTGRTFGGGEALELGLANRCVSPGDLDAMVDTWVAELLAMPHAAATEVKAVLSASAQSRWADELAAGLELAATEP
jgi:enoyl-CoA hydratase/carnithine racemase